MTKQELMEGISHAFRSNSSGAHTQWCNSSIRLTVSAKTNVNEVIDILSTHWRVTLCRSSGPGVETALMALGSKQTASQWLSDFIKFVVPVICANELL